VQGHLKRDQWNVLDVLGRTRLEEAYSDAIAWLFKPWEAHGLGTQVLQLFINKCWPSANLDWKVLLVKTRTGAGSGVVDIEVKGKGWWLAVENKINAAENLGQTLGYSKHYVSLGHPNKNVFLALLTPDGRRSNARASKFCPFKYRTLREIFQELRPKTACGRIVVQHMVEQISSRLEWS